MAKFRIRGTETWTARTHCVIEYDGDIDELLDAAESLTMDDDSFEDSLRELGAKIIEVRVPSLNDVDDWELNDLDYERM